MNFGPDAIFETNSEHKENCSSNGDADWSAASALASEELLFADPSR